MLVKFKLDSDYTAAQLADRLAVAGGDKSRFINELVTFLMGSAGGILKPLEIKAQIGVVQAAGTVTCASVEAADTVTIAGVALTAVSGTPDADEFDISGTDTADALSLVAAINANATLAAIVTATSALGVVTITAKEGGSIGNAIAITSSNGTRLAVVAMADGANATEHTFNFFK